MPFLRIIVTACCLCLASGCFVLDELDNGRDMMKHPHFGNAPAKKKAAARPTTEPQSRGTEALSAVREHLEQWWGTARSLTSEEVDDDLVRCELADGVRFMNRNGCLHAGGVPRRARG